MGASSSNASGQGLQRLISFFRDEVCANEGFGAIWGKIPFQVAHTFFSHWLPYVFFTRVGRVRHAAAQTSVGRSFEKQNFFGTCNPERRNPTWSSIGPGRAALTSDTRTARVEEQGARARVSREGVSPGAVTYGAAAARDTPPRLFGSSDPRLGVRPRRLRVPSAPFPSPSLTPCPSPSPQKGKMAQTPTFKLILVGDGGTGACARLPRASEASRSAAERLVFKI